MRISRAHRTRLPHRARLRTRVLVGVLSVTIAALAAFDFAAVTEMHRYLISQSDTQLRNVLRLYGPLAARGKAPEHPRTQQEANAVTHGPRDIGQFYVLLMPSPEQRWYVSGRRDMVPAFGTMELMGHLSTGTGFNERGLFSDRPIREMARYDHGGYLIAAVDLSSVDQTIAQLERILIIGSVAAVLIVALGGGWLIRRGLRPIEEMAAQADWITAGDLTDRVGPEDARTEVGRLGAALNGMLARIEASVTEREASQQLTRRFFADASHELRNPLASLQANAELYQQRAIPGRPDVDETMQRIGTEAQRMGRLVDDMLRLARLDQAPGQQRRRVDVTALVEDCAGRAHRTSPERSWRLATEPGLLTEGDEEMLRRALDNLLANVGTHTPAGTTATVTAESHDGTVRIEVRDDGPGVPAGELPRIFDRFYRAGAPPQRRGSGLGLAIVAAIAAAHNGTATAALNNPRGLRVTLALPSVTLARVPAGQASFRS
jgi:two-component system, OmpR family, sensor kinase